MVLAGLGARDSLRLEAGYPLHGHELSDEISPLAAGLGWTVKFDKGIDFIGRAALQAEKLNGSPRRVIFFEDRRPADRAPRHARARWTGATVGQVLSGTLLADSQRSHRLGAHRLRRDNQPLTAEIRGTAMALRTASNRLLFPSKNPQ